MQAEKQCADPDWVPLNIACVFSPPAEGDPDVRQIQEDLPQEQADNEDDPEGKKEFPGLHPGLICSRPFGAKPCPNGTPHTSEGQRPGFPSPEEVEP